MPYDQVMHKFKTGKLHSGSKSGPKVKSRQQAIAIMLSEKRASKSKPEYRSAGKGPGAVGPAGAVGWPAYQKKRNTKGILGK